MEIKSQSKAIEFLIKAIPYPEQIKELGLDYDSSVYFTWRSSRYKIELSTGSVMVVDGSVLIGDDSSILIRRLLELEAIKDYMNEKRK